MWRLPKLAHMMRRHVLTTFVVPSSRETRVISSVCKTRELSGSGQAGCGRVQMVSRARISDRLQSPAWYT